MNSNKVVVGSGRLTQFFKALDYHPGVVGGGREAGGVRGRGGPAGRRE